MAQVHTTVKKKKKPPSPEDSSEGTEKKQALNLIGNHASHKCLLCKKKEEKSC